MVILTWRLPALSACPLNPNFDNKCIFRILLPFSDIFIWKSPSCLDDKESLTTTFNSFLSFFPLLLSCRSRRSVHPLHVSTPFNIWITIIDRQICMHPAQQCIPPHQINDPLHCRLVQFDLCRVMDTDLGLLCLVSSL